MIAERMDSQRTSYATHSHNLLPYSNYNCLSASLMGPRTLVIASRGLSEIAKKYKNYGISFHKWKFDVEGFH